MVVSKPPPEVSRVSKFPQEVTKTRNFALVVNLAISSAVATQNYVRIWLGVVNHSSSPHKENVGS